MIAKHYGINNGLTLSFALSQHPNGCRSYLMSLFLLCSYIRDGKCLLCPWNNSWISTSFIVLFTSFINFYDFFTYENFSYEWLFFSVQIALMGSYWSKKIFNFHSQINLVEKKVLINFQLIILGLKIACVTRWL